MTQAQRTCDTCRRELALCACHPTEQARKLIAWRIRRCLSLRLYREAVNLSVLGAQLGGLEYSLQRQCLAAAVALGDADALEALVGVIGASKDVDEAQRIVHASSLILTQAGERCRRGQWMEARRMLEAASVPRGTMRLEVLRAIVLHGLKEHAAAYAVLERLASAYPGERTVDRVAVYLRAHDERTRRRVGRLIRTGSVPAMIVIAFVGGAFGRGWQIGALPASEQSVSPTPSERAMNAGQMLGLALSKDAESLLRLSQEMTAKGILTEEIRQRLEDERSSIGKRDYGAAQGRLARRDTTGAVRLLRSAAAAMADDYWVDDALYQLMRIAATSSDAAEARRIALRLQSDYADSPFNNSHTARIAAQGAR